MITSISALRGKVGPDVPGLANYARSTVQAGADVISGINTLGPCLSIDVDTRRPQLGTAGGIGHLSRAPLKPLALAHAAEVAKAVDVPVCGGSGTRDGQDALELFMVGCRCVYVHTAAILSGLGVFEENANQLESFLERKGFASLAEVIGVSSKYLQADQAVRSLRAKVDAELCNSCGACYRSCLHGAIRTPDNASVEEAVCTGCGLCATLWSKVAIALLEIA